MTFLHTRDGMALTTTCQLCGMSTRSLSESAIYLSQRGHDALTCQLMRAAAARPVEVIEPEVEDDVDRCPYGHERAGNIGRYGHCLACRREKGAMKKMAESRCGTMESGVAQGRMEPAKTNRPTRERRTVLSTPSATNGKEAVDS